MTALTHAVVDGGMASHLAFSIGAIAQLAEYRIVYPVVAGSSPAVLALVASCGLRWVVAREFWHASFFIFIKGRG